MSLDPSHPCIHCGYRYASYGKVDPITKLVSWFCGWVGGECVCIGKGRAK
jgi:hypothetical protein